ncbi:hypothetical protein FNW52_11465 [Flavobacterium sp. ZT3R18]|uniref:XAC2610-related protein n=1 Tax=Flavobacterium sp. ZT3R18 TaxID=2594429 RepID=UPI00117AD683|nr:hypothetical protein [Flavobacterium sp. ZT3R18]TRX35331.1 hypothetical protein FNW52_11465 [Flavobacterium sp. ZT3R18]
MVISNTNFIQFTLFICKKGLVSFLLCFSLLTFGQKVQTGIYELDYNTEANYLHQFIPMNSEQGQDQNIKYVYNQKYSSLFDENYGIKYAVVIKKEDPNNKENYSLEMVLLNKKIIDGYGVSYNDTIIRKYFKLDLSIGLKNNYWFESTQNGEGFLSYYDAEEYNNSQNLAYKFDDHNFYKKDNSFFLKGRYFKHEIDSVKVDSSSYVSNVPYGSYYSKMTNYVLVKQPIITFKIRDSKFYKDILPLQTDGVKFYTSVNDRDTKDFRVLNAGDFIAVTNETDEWYYGEWISVDGEVTAGKIFIEDLSKSESITKKVNGLTLKIKYILHNKEDWGDAGEIVGIKIQNKDKLLQVIKKPGLINDTENVLYTQDVNFDGYQDLVVYAQSSGSGPNNTDNYYVFNPKTQKFIFNDALSNLSQPQIDFKSKTVYAAWRGGAATHGAEKYKWIKGKLILVEYYETNYLDEVNVVETHTFLKKGKMVGKTRKVKESQLKPPF